MNARWFSKRRNYDLPLIAPAAIEAYLSRDLADFNFLKQAPKAELAVHARALGFRYVTEPRACQLVCNIIGAERPRFLFHLDMGAGKSKATLDLIRFRKARKELQRALIVVPEFVHISSWQDQLKEHAPDLRCVVLLGSREDRFELIDRKADVYLINYAGLQVYMAEKKKAKRGKAKRGVAPDAAALFASLFNFVVFDEIHRIRSWDSLTFRLCCWLGAGAPFCYANTGTPFGRDPMMLWPQFKMVDDGETFGLLGLFRAVFFEAKKARFGGYDYKLLNGEEGRIDRQSDLNRVMKHRSIVYEEHELGIDLPPKTLLRVNVRMPPEQRMFYDRILDRMKEARGDYASLDNVFTRMRQLGSGFLSLRADDESRIEVEIDPNPKLEALRQVVTDLPASEKFLVFHQFTYSGNRIRGLLDEMKVPWATLYGGVKDAAGEYQRFLTDKRCRAFVLQNQAGSEAINPQGVCRYAWFYERPDDALISQQAEKRVYRPGQERPVFVGDIVSVGNSAEENLLVYLQQSRDVRAAVLRGEVKLS